MASIVPTTVASATTASGNGNGSAAAAATSGAMSPSNGNMMEAGLSAAVVCEQFFMKMSDIIADSGNDPSRHTSWRSFIALAVFQFTFEAPDSTWVIDTKAVPSQVYRSAPPIPPQFYFQASESDFLSLIEAPRAKAVAIYSSGRIKLGGSHELFQTLKPLFQEVRKQVLIDRVEAARRLPRRHPGAIAARRGASALLAGASTGGSATPSTMSTSAGMPKPIFKDKNDWMADELVDLCGNCGQPFFVLRRRHHCRVCGGVFCHECSSYLVDKRRACFPCFEDIKTKIAVALRRGPTGNVASTPMGARPKVGFRPRTTGAATPKTTSAISPVLSGANTPSSPSAPYTSTSTSNGDNIPSLRIRTSSDHNNGIDDNKRGEQKGAAASVSSQSNGHTSIPSSSSSQSQSLSSHDNGPEGIPRVASGGSSVAFTPGPSPGLINRRLSQVHTPPPAISSSSVPLSEAEQKVKRLEELLAQKKRGNIMMAALLVVVVILLKVPTTQVTDMYESLREAIQPWFSASYDALSGIHYAKVPGLFATQVLNMCIAAAEWLSVASPLAVMAAVGAVLLLLMMLVGVICRKRGQQVMLRSRSGSLTPSS